jgi:hypothetical protein
LGGAVYCGHLCKAHSCQKFAAFAFDGQCAQLSKTRGSNVNKLLILLILLLVYGCSSLALKSAGLRHESSESRLLTEQEFMERVSQSATLIYEGMITISEAAKLYAVDNNGSFPLGNSKVVRSLLLAEGYLETWPVIPPFAFTDPDQDEFRFVNAYDDMDGIGAFDDIIYAQDLKIEVCEEFIHRYSSFGPGDIIHDYEANKNNYPGELIGRHMKIYAIGWSMTKSPDYCDIEWVMKYND